MIKIILKCPFTKYLFSYILCLILPILVFSFLYKNCFVAEYSQQFISKATESLDNTYEYLDLQISNLNNISYQILSSRQISDIAFQENPPIITFYTVGELLNNYINTNESISDIWLFDKQSHNYYSSKQMFNSNSFKKYGPLYPNISHQKFEKYLFDLEYPFWIEEEDIKIYNRTYPLMTYFASYPNSSISGNFVLFFYIKTSLFDQPLKSVIQWDQSTTAIIDHKGNIVYSMNREMEPIVDTVKTEYSIHDNVTMLIDINHEKYLVHMKNSTQNGLMYLSIISYRQLVADVQQFTQVFVAMIVILIITGSALIFFLMKYNYNPIRKLIGFAKNQLNIAHGQSTDINDIEQIRVAMENIVDKNISLVQYNRKYVQEHTLFQLIKGNTDIDLNEVHQANIDCNGNFNIVAIFRLDINAVNDIEDFKNIFNRAMLALSYTCNTYFIEYLEQRSFIVIFTQDKDDPYFENKIRAVRDRIAAITNSDIFVGIGNCCKSINDISESFTQARSVLRYKTGNNTDKVISFRDFHNEEVPNYLYLKAELSTLEDSIMNKNPVKIEFIVSQLIDTVRNTDTSYFFAICICYDIINTIFKGIHDIKGSTAELAKKYQTVFRETFDHTVDDLVNIIVSLSQEVISSIDISLNSNSIVNYGAIVKFIEENYKQSNFSVQCIADHFNLSVSNLGHQFKAYTGTNISSYISILKMNYAKELLSTTSLSVSEIAAKLGYFQTSSFIRKFKQSENMTPGEYRNKEIDA